MTNCKQMTANNSDIHFCGICLITLVDVVAGLAPVAGMCTRSSSCTVNEGRHFESVYVVAHEIGHKYVQFH